MWIIEQKSESHCYEYKLQIISHLHMAQARASFLYIKQAGNAFSKGDHVIHQAAGRKARETFELYIKANKDLTKQLVLMAPLFARNKFIRDFVIRFSFGLTGQRAQVGHVKSKSLFWRSTSNKTAAYKLS